MSGCDLCDDNTAPLHLHARCHFTAPLRAELEGGVLSLFCYLPDCGRLVARFRVEAVVSDSLSIGEGTPEP